MHSFIILYPLVVALAAAAEPLAEPRALPAGISYAQQFRRDASGLSRRLEADPKDVCGANFNDCGDGYCCRSESPCAGTLYGIPACKDPTKTDGPLGGTEPAVPYKDPLGALSSLGSVYDQLTAGQTPTQFLGDPTDAPKTASGGGTTNAAKPASAEPSNGTPGGGPSTFGQTAGIVGAIWGLAGLAGAGLVLL